MKKRSNIKRLAAVAAIIGCQSSGVWAQNTPLTDDQVQALLQRVNQLEQQVKALQQNQPTLIATNGAFSTGLVSSSTGTNTSPAPTISLGANGLIARSSDSNFTMIAHGYAQVDERNYFGQKTAPDTLLLRRVRPIVEGTVWQDYNYRLMLDFGSGTGSGSTANNTAVLDDAYVNAHFWQQAQFQIGKYKSPIGLERLQSTSDLLFVETGFATELTPNYDIGAMVHNDYFNQPVGYAFGLLSGSGDNQSQDRDVDEGKDIVGRLFLQPFLNSPKNPLHGLGFGAAGSIGSHTGGTVPTYTTPGQQTFFGYNSTNLAPAGIQYRIDPQLYYYYGPFGVEAEYILSSQKYSALKAYPGGVPGVSRPRFNDSAWQVEATYFLTGEKNSFKATSLKHVEPLHNFGLGSGSGWGAFEIVGRVQELTLDDTAFAHGVNSLALPGSADKAFAWGAGLNWYLNPNVKLNLDYESTTFTGGVAQPGTTAFKPEHVILSQAQIAF